MDITLRHNTTSLKGQICTSSSKSESNRLLIIQALCNEHFQIENLSNAEDTKVLQSLLKAIKNNSQEVLNVGLAGTAMRFLTAYLSVQNHDYVLTGEDRMLKRPIKVLVDALIELGVDIEYMDELGYPPIKITGAKIAGAKIKIDGSISSQYISALLMIAPKMERGLTIEFEGELISKPYVNMTIELMKYYGIDIRWNDDTIVVQQGNYLSKNITVESDWSSASYYYSIAALAKEGTIKLKGLKKESLQADAVVRDIYKNFGVETSYTNDGIVLTKKVGFKTPQTSFEFDFINCPDIAQTVAVTCAALGIEAKLKGLKSLRIKETDRIAAVQTELNKLGYTVKVENDDILIHAANNELRKPVEDNAVYTYNDHRMAMAFAPLALLNEITIKDAEVVKKSYPTFWKDLESLGFDF